LRLTEEKIIFLDGFIHTVSSSANFMNRNLRL